MEQVASYFCLVPVLFGTEIGNYALPIHVYQKDRGVHWFWFSIIALFLLKSYSYLYFYLTRKKPRKIIVYKLIVVISGGKDYRCF